MRATHTAPSEIADIRIEQLLLDEENPRLSSSAVDKPNQEDLVRVLWTEMAVDGWLSPSRPTAIIETRLS